MKYKDVLANVYKTDLTKIPQRLLCLDPGETTGWALFENGLLTKCDQEKTVDTDKLIWHNLEKLFYAHKPTQVVCEDYRIYAHKLERHSNSQVMTLRLIGGIDLLCENNDAMRDAGFGWFSIPIHYQMAAQAKGFITDDRLKDWGMWQEGMKHSRDAIRHGLYYLVITNRPK